MIHHCRNQAVADSAAPIAPEPRREAEPGDFHDVRAAWDFGIAEALEVIGEQVRANRRQQPHRPGMSAVRIGGDQIMGVIAVISVDFILASDDRSEEHTSELQSLMRISYAVFCLKKKKKKERKQNSNRKHKQQ